jgi:RND family efflux transporter MFP subunit
VNHDTPDAMLLGPANAETVTPMKRRSGLVAVIAVVLLVALGFGIYAGIRNRVDAETALAHETLENAVPIVQVVRPIVGAPDAKLTLPGQTMAFSDAPIYARTSGYLKSWTSDIGTHVKQGQLLAVIEAPELDHQLRQARADLQTAQANMKLASITADRTASLLKTQSVSTQERDNAASAYTADQSIVASRQADVDRLEQLQSYENIYAPFDGVITARNTDIGHLINAGAGVAASELFHLTAIKTLRIFVAVPETDSPAMKIGAEPTVTLDEYPGEVFKGMLARTDNTINPTSRTLRVEVDVDNADGRLLPGAYVFVHFALPSRARSVTVPSNVLLFRAEGLRVGVVRGDSAQLVPITIGRDYGDKVEVLSGLNADDQVILNPSDSLIDGTTVKIASAAPAPSH